MVITAIIGGEVYTFTEDNTVIYRFVTRPGLDHVFYNDDTIGFYLFHRPFVCLAEQAQFTVVTERIPPEWDEAAFEKYLNDPPNIEVLTEQASDSR